jgi:hypothetical protein
MDGVLPRKLVYTIEPMRFTSQAEMDRNAKQWLAILLLGIAAVCTIVTVGAFASNDETMLAVLKLFAR